MEHIPALIEAGVDIYVLIHLMAFQNGKNNLMNLSERTVEINENWFREYC